MYCESQPAGITLHAGYAGIEDELKLTETGPTRNFCKPLLVVTETLDVSLLTETELTKILFNGPQLTGTGLAEIIEKSL